MANCASSASEHFFKRTVVLGHAGAANQAHLRSHSGHGSSFALWDSNQPKFKAEPHHFRTLVLERMRLPLHVTEAKCECGADLDRLGRHRAACPRSGRLSTRAFGTRKDTGQDSPGGGSHCVMQWQAEGHGHRSVCTGREGKIEVLALGLPLHHGAQLTVDVTLRCALTANGEAHPNAAAEDIAVCSRARVDKEHKYTELVQETGVVWWWWHWKPEAGGTTKPFSSSTILRRPDQGKHHQ